MLETKVTSQELNAKSDRATQRSVDMLLKRLSENDSEPKDAVIRTKGFLSRAVKRAKRQNVWRRFSSLGRNFIGLCISLPIKFRGRDFLRALVKTLKELMLLLSPMYRFWFRGRELAYRISEAAYNFGNKDALNWRNDRNFTIYWGMVLSSGYMGGDRC
jgi:hypothetical protein